jgi:hypothetical protein
MTQPAMTAQVMFRPEFTRRVQKSAETVRRWLKAGKLPRPDVDGGRYCQGWKLSTLKDAGFDFTIESAAPLG